MLHFASIHCTNGLNWDSKSPFFKKFTITPYGKEIEENIEKKEKIVETFKNLSEKTGKEKVILRYDPVILQTQLSIYS